MVEGNGGIWQAVTDWRGTKPTRLDGLRCIATLGDTIIDGRLQWDYLTQSMHVTHVKTPLIRCSEFCGHWYNSPDDNVDDINILRQKKRTR